MTSGYSRVEHALKILRSRPSHPGEGVAVPVGPDRHVDEARLALDHLGTVHLLVKLPEGRSRFDLPLGEVLPTEWFLESQNGEERTSVDVASIEPALNATFLSLVGEMLTRVDESGGSCLDELMKVLSSWREALSRERMALSRHRTIGLFGELTVLARLARVDPARAKEAWRGEEGYRHDFFRRNALEVKTYTGVGSPMVEIHGAYQLDPPVGGKLHLLALRLEESADGQTIADLMQVIDSYGLPKGILSERSTDESPVASEDTMRFVVAEERLFHVTESFPGVRASRTAALSLVGVSHLRYALLLDACPNRLEPSSLSQILDNL
ncbi:PD-(D/E)XK motif protein [Paramicrobacterium fandaimingii]|uniref:PD-(D/E)XK motif protein n=1 Tax=Paramicrobacterium fandaimingii TaxID=2708079 RepID=UPI0014219787|nr:PD-(D/E)XK motif protein [Microbacterium fandaimingii]